MKKRILNGLAAVGVMTLLSCAAMGFFHSIDEFRVMTPKQLAFIGVIYLLVFIKGAMSEAVSKETVTIADAAMFPDEGTLYVSGSDKDMTTAFTRKFKKLDNNTLLLDKEKSNV